jgi:hypothetical protein
MEDVGATHGYLVCPTGYTKAAEKRAQRAVTIRLVPLDHLENFDPASWPKCQNSRCKQGLVFWNGYPAFNLLLRSVDSSKEKQMISDEFLHFVGKCDCCGRFHVKCNHSGEMFSLTDENEHKGCCLPLGFWLTSVEQDENGRSSAELHAITKICEVITVDRRPM